MTVEDTLKTVIKRRRFLEHLREEPAEPRDIVDELGVSRPTVHRTIEELTGQELIAKTNSGAWRLTEKGRLCLATLERSFRTLESVDNARSLLSDLPKGVEVPVEIFQDANVREATPPSPTEPLTEFVENVKRADTLQILSRGETIAESTSAVYQQSFVEGELRCEAVVSEEMAQWLITERTEKVQDAIPSQDIELRVRDSLPFALVLFTTDGKTRVTLVVYDEKGTYRGEIRTEDSAAVAWAKDTFQHYWQNGTPIAEVFPKDN